MLTKDQLNFLNYTIQHNGHTTDHQMCKTNWILHCTNCIFKTNNDCYPVYVLKKAKQLLKQDKQKKLKLWKNLNAD